RAEANRRLANLYETLFDHERAIGAWERVLTSPLRVHALDALENLLQQTGAEEGLARILDMRAQGEPDADKARAVALRAAELRASRQSNTADTLAVWRHFLEMYGPSREVHARILPMLESEKRFPELAQVLK